jgi:hypothetical protein
MVAAFTNKKKPAPVCDNGFKITVNIQPIDNAPAWQNFLWDNFWKDVISEYAQKLGRPVHE